MRADEGFRELVAAESGRLVRLGELLTGRADAGRGLAEAAVARVLGKWPAGRQDEPRGLLRRALFEVYGQWWRRDLRTYDDGPLKGLTPVQRAATLLAAEGEDLEARAQLLDLTPRAAARATKEVDGLDELLKEHAEPVELAGAERVVKRARRRGKWIAGAVVVALVAAGIAGARLAQGDPPDRMADADCPAALPTQLDNDIEGLDEVLMPVRPDRTVLCRYADTGDRTGITVLSKVQAEPVLARINDAPESNGDLVCVRDEVLPYVLRISGEGQTVTLRADPTGCGTVTNGDRTVVAGRDLLWQLEQGQRGEEPAASVCATIRRGDLNTGGKLAGTMVGLAPDRVVACPDGTAGSPGEVAGQTARSLAADLELAGPPGDLTTGCPGDHRLAVVLISGAQRVQLSVDADCGWVSNTRKVARVDQALLNRLRALAQLPAG